MKTVSIISIILVLLMISSLSAADVNTIAAPKYVVGVDKVIGDLSDAESLDRACKGCQSVYHSAAMVGGWQV